MSIILLFIENLTGRVGHIAVCLVDIQTGEGPLKSLPNAIWIIYFNEMLLVTQLIIV